MFKVYLKNIDYNSKYSKTITTFAKLLSEAILPNSLEFLSFYKYLKKNEKHKVADKILNEA